MEQLLKYNDLDFFDKVIVAGGEISFPAPYVSRTKQATFPNEQQVELSSWTLNGSFYISKIDDTGVWWTWTACAPVTTPARQIPPLQIRI